MNFGEDRKTRVDYFLIFIEKKRYLVERMLSLPFFRAFSNV